MSYVETLVKDIVNKMGKPESAAIKIIQIFEDQWISSKEDLQALTLANYTELKIPMGFAKKLIQRVNEDYSAPLPPHVNLKSQNDPQPIEIESEKKSDSILEDSGNTESLPLRIGGNSKPQEPKRKLDQEKIKKVMENMSSNVSIKSNIKAPTQENTDFKPNNSKIQVGLLQNHFNEMENFLETEISKLSQLQNFCGSPNKLKTLKMMKGICEKILKDPKDQKFRRINIDNPKVKKFIWNSKHAQNILSLIGFQEIFDKETNKTFIILEANEEYLEYVRIADMHLGMRVDSLKEKNKYSSGGIIQRGNNAISKNIVNYVKEGTKSISERIHELKTERRILRNRHELTPIVKIYHANNIDRNAYTNVQCKTFFLLFC